jgi:uncharacterized protein YjiS (DUF1127 family)
MEQTMALVSTIRSIEFGIAERVSSFFSELGEMYQRYRVFKQTMNELNALSSRELADLGIHRSMITRVALEAAYGK